ncbi:MAG: hypothetical protein IKQ23_05400, partial [Treponema sp.]|nr:hypothetical protein [Treponema sp.]
MRQLLSSSGRQFLMLYHLIKLSTLAIFYLSNKQRHGGRVKCLRRSSRVFARKPGHKNGKEAIFVALSGVPAFASIAG